MLEVVLLCQVSLLAFCSAARPAYQPLPLVAGDYTLSEEKFKTFILSWVLICRMSHELPTSRKEQKAESPGPVSGAHICA